MSVKIGSQADLEANIQKYREDHKKQEDRQRKLEAITNPFAEYGVELEAAIKSSRRSQKEDVEAKIVKLYNNGKKEKEFNTLYTEYELCRDRQVRLFDSIRTYHTKHGGR